MKLVFMEIHWSDSETANGWERADKVKQPTTLCKSRGYFVKESNDYLTIAADHDEENEMFNRFIHIPIVNIKKRKRLKL